MPIGDGGWAVTNMGVPPDAYIAAGYTQGTFVECYIGEDPQHQNPRAQLWQADHDGWPHPLIPCFGGYDGEPLLRDVLPLLDEVDEPLRVYTFALFTGLDPLRPEDADTLKTWGR